MPSRPVGDGPRRESTYDRERQRDGGRGDGKSSGAAQTGSSKRSPADEDEDRIGPYLIGEEIGRGSFATVFKGTRYVSWISLQIWRLLWCSGSSFGTR